MNVKRVFDILQLHENNGREDKLCVKVNKMWKKYSSQEFIDHSNAVSETLIKEGLQIGDKVGIIAVNLPEWNFVDFGSQQAGVITVPIFPTISTDDLAFILSESEPKLVFISSKEILRKLNTLAEKGMPLPKIISFSEDLHEVDSYSNYISENYKTPISVELLNRKAIVSEEDVFTILYTSGTSGQPKGVMLTHKNMVSNLKAAENLAPFEEWWRALSFLPLNHVYERMVSTLYLYKNLGIYYAEGYETIAENLKEVKPQIFVTVPRLLERVYEKLTATGNKLVGYKKIVFNWALKLALGFKGEGRHSAWFELKRKIADKLVYSKWRQALGGELVCMVSGGAALQVRLARVFSCSKLVILEGYGLTETSPLIAVNNFEPGCIRFGTVGPVIKNIEVKIAEDGEILVKGPNVMKGYYKNEQATKESIDEYGFFHTGDIGEMVEGKFLKITDRKKEIFKLSAGKYIAPLKIEGMLRECPYVENCMVIGESEKFASALIVPAFANIQQDLRERNLPLTSNEEIASSEVVKAEINQFIKEMNKHLAPYEQLKRVELLINSWSVDGGELTPKLSLKRKVIKEKYKSHIDRIYKSGYE